MLLSEGIQELPLRYISFSLVYCVLCSSKYLLQNPLSVVLAFIQTDTQEIQ
jgi:hypothetical protein